jgi:hypothetical protein
MDRKQILVTPGRQRMSTKPDMKAEALEQARLNLTADEFLLIWDYVQGDRDPPC